MPVEQLTVRSSSPPEQCAEVSRLLAVDNLNLRAVNVHQEDGFTILRCIVSDPYEGKRILTAKGYDVDIEEVVAVEVPDIPGGFAKVMDLLEQKAIGVEYLYSTLEKHKDRAVIVLKTSDIPNAIAALEDSFMILVDRF